VQDDTKVFITTIRPRSESVTQIPAIPFSFFDPDKREYQTVYTQPIDIEVEKAESLQLDAIVSKSGGVESSMDDKQQSNLAIAPSFDLQNDYTENVLRQESSSSRNGWWYFAAIPAGCWLMLVVGKLAFAFPAVVGKFRTPISLTKEKVRQAKTGEEVATAMRDFVAALTKSDGLTNESAVGQIRELGDYETANQIESLFHRVDRMGTSTTSWNESQAATVEELKDECGALLEDVERSYNNRRKSSRKPSSRSRKRKLTATSLLLVLFSLPGIAQAQNNETDSQLQLLAQANEAYRTASELSESDPAESNQQFRVAAENYQRLVGDGVRNSELFFNLGNAWNQSGEPANAILNYHRSLILNPGLEKARRNLELLQQGIATDNEDKQSAQVGLASLLSAENAKSILTKAVGWLGWNTMTIIFAAASLIFWALVCLKTIKRSTPAIRWAIAPFVLMCVFGLALYTNQTAHSDLAIVTADTIELRRGDGSEFAVDTTLQSCSGQEVRITDVRHNWFKVELPSGTSGWIPGKDLEQVSL
jgi:tetratricopeptide (TPR) repeat protein